MTGQSNRRGFSLVELLLVVVIIGLLAAIGVPSVVKSRNAAQKGATVAVLRTLHTDELMYFTQKGRYGRLNEINSTFQNSLGTTVGSRIYRGNYFFLMSPTPNDTTLRSRYQVIAYRVNNRLNYPAFRMAQDGTIQTILP